MKTTAAVLYEMGLPRPYATSQPLRIEELDLEGPGEGEVLVEVMAAGLCHSDLSVISGKRPRVMPMAIGHEAAGIVEGQYQLVWSYSLNPQLGFTPMPYDGGNRLTAKRYTVTSKTTAMFQPGAYYVKVDATTLDGSRSYAFVSSAPAFTVTRQDER